MKIHAIFRGTCPNCNGENSDIRLRYGIPCSKCIPIPTRKLLRKIIKMNKNETRKYILDLLIKFNTLKHYRNLYEIENKIDEIENLFYGATGSKLWSAQRTWLKRALKGKSFAIIAPTGMGKTVFGIILAIYFASIGKKSYILLPTSLLAHQVYLKINKFLDRLNLQDIKVVAYHSIFSRSKCKKILNEIINGNYDILITTSYFLPRHFEKLDKKFDFIFVDDVDSFIKSSKNVDKVLMLLGFNQEIIELGFKAINLRSKIRKLFRSKYASQDQLNIIREELLNTENKIENFKRNNSIGILIVSGASIRAKRTKRIKLFRELLGFEIGSKAEGIRNIVDMYIKPRKRNIIDEAIRLVSILGDGGLIFIPMDKGSKYVNIILDELSKRGIRATTYEKAKGKILEKYRSREYDVLVGVASYRSPLARGIDLPERVRYAIFIGVPKFKISLDITEEFRPFKAIILLANLREFIENPNELDLIDKYIIELRRVAGILKRDEIEKIASAIKQKIELEGFLGKIQKLFLKVALFLEEILRRRDIRTAIAKSPHLSIEKLSGKPYIIVPDVIGYLQASGRTSRMYAGGVTKGLSIIIIDDEKAFNGLIRGLRWYVEDIKFEKMTLRRIKKVIGQVDSDRRKVRMLLEGKILPEFRDIVKTALLVVESPSKARTIAKFFGSPSKREINGVPVYEISTGDYILIIVASKGHIFDLVTQEGYHGVKIVKRNFIPIYSSIKRCRKCNEQFSDPINICPICGGKLDDKITVIKVLQEIASEVDTLLIGTDADAEGEKIGWDIAQALAPYVREVKRIEFHEITKRALIKALNNPRELNLKLVESQILRRIEDRWIGFELSNKVQNKFNRRDLSAGRVQTPVLGWIVNRTKETRKSIMDNFELTLENKLRIRLSLKKLRKKELEKIVEELKKSNCKITKVTSEIVELNPYPPFSTDSMLREATLTLKLRTNEIMSIAQDLFELGLITYHRTDSIRVSSIGMNIARNYITEKWGEEYVKLRGWSKKGAHECIRPTRPIDAYRLKTLISIGIIRLAKRLTPKHYALYKLIFNRFIASQMKAAKVKKQIINAKVLNCEINIETFTEIIHPGYTLIYPIKISPEVKKGTLKIIDVKHWRAPALPLYSEGDVIRLMKERGVGRPSTYAKILSTLLERRYVFQTPNRKLVATKLGENVYNYLKESFEKYVSEETTRQLEEKMNKVELGQMNYITILKELYSELKYLSSN